MRFKPVFTLRIIEPLYFNLYNIEVHAVQPVKEGILDSFFLTLSYTFILKSNITCKIKLKFKNKIFIICK